MSRRGRLALVTGLIALVAAIGLLQPTGLVADFDTLAMRIVARLRQWPGADLVTAAAYRLDAIGTGGGRIFIALVIALFLARAGRPRAVMWLLASVAALMAINALVKLVFAAPRPDAIEPLLVVTSHSFPSGHAVGAMTLFGAIALLWPSRALIVLCAAIILATGLSRVWLGVHWPSDIMGGWIAGAAWLLVTAPLLTGRGDASTSVRIVLSRSESTAP
jgi:undecaprenyl-diphosphatase